MRFLAADLGASSGRTIVGTIADGKIDLEETHRFENSMQDIDGEKHWDVMGLVAEIKKGIDAAGKLDGIGIDTWGVDYGLLDANGDLLDKPFAYRDARNENAMPATYERIPKDRLYSITGLQEMPFNTVFQLMADKTTRPDILDKTDKMLLMPNLLSYLLTGTAAWEYTICSTTQLVDAKNRSWSKEVLDALGLPTRIFGDIAMPGTTAGIYNGVPVYLPAMHDTGSAVAAVPAVDAGDWAYLSSGTWSLIGAELDQPILTPESMAADFTNEGGVDGKIRYLKNVNGLWLIQECRRMWQEAGQELSFAEIAAAAEESTFAGIIHPNDSRFMAPENMVEEIAAALQEGGQPAPQNVGDHARCCYVSLARAYKEQLSDIEKMTGKTFERLHIVGGGCQAELLNQLTANELGIPVYTGPVEATAIGNLCVQAMANGLFKNLTETRRAIAKAFPVKVYEPQ